MTAGISAAWTASLRRRWRALIVALAAVTLAVSLTGLALRAPSAQAAALPNLCDANTGASTATLTCSVAIVNSITATGDHSVTTVTVHCTVVACADEQTNRVTSEPFVINAVNLCNGSNEEGGQHITCTLSIINNIDSDTAAAGAAVTAPAIKQCQGTGGGGGTAGAGACSPQVSQPSPLIRACNNSVTGGGGSVDCTVTSGSTTSAAIPLSVDLCNNTGIGGGTFLTCSTAVTTNIVDVTPPSPQPSASLSIGPIPSSSAGPTGTGTAAPTRTARPGHSPTPTTKASGSTRSAAPSPTTRSGHGQGQGHGHGEQVSPMPSGGAGTGS